MEKHSELVSDNGLVFKDMIKSDRLVLLTTSDNRLAIYSPNGKLVSLLSAAQLGGKTNPPSLTVSTDSLTLFFLDSNKNLHSLDLTQKEKALPQLLFKDLKTSDLSSVNNELYFVHGDKIVVMAKQGSSYSESKKKLEIPATWKPVSPQTELIVVGPTHLLVLNEGDCYGVFDTQTGALTPETSHVNAAQFPKFDRHYQVYYKPHLRCLFGVQNGNVVQYFFEPPGGMTKRKYEPGQFGTIQTFGNSGDKVYLVTEQYYIVFSIPPNEQTSVPSLLTVIRLKFPANNPLAKVFHNGEDLLHLIFVAGTKVDTVRITPDWDKFEPVILNNASKGKGAPQHYDGHSQEEYMGQSDEEGYPANGEKRTTKTKKKKVVKKRKRSFDLSGMQHMPSTEYNALKDEHLKSYFYCERIRKHLQKQHLITRDGYIIENPEEYRKNQRLLREHYRSQEPKKGTKKKAPGKGPKQAAESGYDNYPAYNTGTVSQKGGDAERVKKDDFREFLNDVEQVAGGQSKGAAKVHDSQRSGTDLGSEKAMAEAKAKAEREASAKAHAQKDATAKAQAEKDAAAKVQADKDAAAKLQADKEAAAKVQADKDAAAKLQAEKDAAAKKQADKDGQTKPKEQPATDPSKSGAVKDPAAKPADPAVQKPAAMPAKPETDINDY